MLRAFGHRVAMCCNMLGVVGSSLTSFKLEPTTPNMSQQGGQTHATCCVQQCCDVLLACCDRLARALKLKLRVLLASHSVAMATYWVTKIMPTCSPVIGQFVLWYHDCSIK